MDQHDGSVSDDGETGAHRIGAFAAACHDDDVVADEPAGRVEQIDGHDDDDAVDGTRGTQSVHGPREKRVGTQTDESLRLVVSEPKAFTCCGYQGDNVAGGTVHATKLLILRSCSLYEAVARTSSSMLQQTPVVRVAPIWEQWVQRWPLPSAMAASSQAEVLRAWGKLGYPRRALRLHECSRVLAEDYCDEVPRDVDTLLGLPGIGAYTARAVATFAYGQRVPVVDTNVRRVVARALHGNAEPGNPSTTRDLADVEQLLPVSVPRAARYSAALMELGALICTAKNPACLLCPLPECAWIEAGRPAHTGPAKKVQKFAGTDRQVRGKLMSVLRESTGPVERAQLDIVWPTDPTQRDRALDSLLTDGLIEQTESGLFALAGEGSDS